VWEVSDVTKSLLLVALVERNVIEGRAIVFCRTKHRAKKLTKSEDSSCQPFTGSLFL